MAVTAATLLLAGSVTTAAGPQVQGPNLWPLFAGNPQHNAVFGQGPGVAWTLHPGGMSKASAVVNGVLYAAVNPHNLAIRFHVSSATNKGNPSSPGEIWAVRAATGQVVWKAFLPSTVHELTVWHHTVFAGTGGATLLKATAQRWIRGGGQGGAWAVSARTGKLIWSIRTRGSVQSGVGVDAKTGIAVFGTGAGWVYGIQAATGHVLWRDDLQADVSPSHPNLVNGVAYLDGGGPTPTALYALDERTGRVLWSVRGPNGDCPPAVDQGRVFAVGSAQAGPHLEVNRLYAVSAATGRILWTYTTPPGPMVEGDEAPPPTVADGVVYMASPFTNAVYAVNEASGKLMWRATLHGQAKSGVVVDPATQLVYVADGGGFLWALHTKDGSIAGVVYLGGNFLAGSNPILVDGTLYLGGTRGIFALPARAVVSHSLP